MAQIIHILAQIKETYQEVGWRRHCDPVVEQLPCVVVHRTALFHRLEETQTHLIVFKTECLLCSVLKVG